MYNTQIQISEIWLTSAKIFLAILTFNRWKPLRFVGFSSKLVGGPLQGPLVGVPSLVQIVWKLRNFSLLLWRRHCVASLPQPGCLLPPGARPYAAFSRPRAPVLTEAEIFSSPQTWLYSDMKLPWLFYCCVDPYEIWHTHRQWLEASVWQIWSESQRDLLYYT